MAWLWLLLSWPLISSFEYRCATWQPGSGAPGCGASCGGPQDLAPPGVTDVIVFRSFSSVVPRTVTVSLCVVTFVRLDRPSVQDPTRSSLILGGGGNPTELTLPGCPRRLLWWRQCSTRMNFKLFDLALLSAGKTLQTHTGRLGEGGNFTICNRRRLRRTPTLKRDDVAPAGSQPAGVNRGACSWRRLLRFPRLVFHVAEGGLAMLAVCVMGHCADAHRVLAPLVLGRWR